MGQPWADGAIRPIARCSISSSSRRQPTKKAARRRTGPRGFASRSPACAGCCSACSIASGGAAMAESALAQFRPLDRAAVAALANATHGDPFALLGPHESEAGSILRAFLPGARSVEVLARTNRTPLGRLETNGDSGLFEGLVRRPDPY